MGHEDWNQPFLPKVFSSPLRKESWGVSIYCTRTSSCVNNSGYCKPFRLLTAEDSRYPSGYFAVFQNCIQQAWQLSYAVCERTNQTVQCSVYSQKTEVTRNNTFCLEYYWLIRCIGSLIHKSSNFFWSFPGTCRATCDTEPFALRNTVYISLLFVVVSSPGLILVDVSQQFFPFLCLQLLKKSEDPGWFSHMIPYTIVTSLEALYGVRLSKLCRRTHSVQVWTDHLT